MSQLREIFLYHIHKALIDRGKILEQVARKSKIPITKIASEMGIVAKTVYRHFQIKDLDDTTMLQYGRVLRHDFSKEVPSLADAFNFLNEPQAKYYTRTKEDLIEEIESWKNKYINLLEKYNRLVEEKLGME